jgi:hypothetical protein
MAVLPIALTVLLTAGALAFVLLPLWRRPNPLRVAPDGTVAAFGDTRSWTSREELMARRDALYATLRDAEFDHEMGKLGDADYQVLRTRTMHEAAQVLRQLDSLTPAAEAMLDREIEQAVARLRATPTSAGPADLPTAVVHAVEAEIAALIKHSGAAPALDNLACPNCGQAYRAGDAFCVFCGAGLGPGARREAS